MKKNIKKNVCVYITKSRCYTAEINTTLYINYTSIENVYRLPWWLRW